MNPTTTISFIFFGTDEFATIVLEELKSGHLLPALIVCAPDRKAGRGLALTKPATKIWAERNSVKVLQPEKLDAAFSNELTPGAYQLFVVASYGKIIPQAIIDIPKHGTLNVHPSLLPKYRGPSPIESQILADEKEVGVSIMQIDAKMDHGPILIQEKIAAAALPMPEPVLSKTLAAIGGRILSDSMQKWIDGEIVAEEQNHHAATITTFIKKEDGLIDLSDNPRKNYLKFLAFQRWPSAYFFISRNGKKVRVIIKSAFFENNEFRISSVLPEGGKEMSYEDFTRGYTH